MPSDSQTIKLVTVGVIGFLSGYAAHCLVFSPKARKLKVTKTRRDSESLSEYETESELDLEIEIDSTELNAIAGEVRMNLVIRLDLKMGKGKAAAQCSHATLAAYKKMATPGLVSYNPEMLKRWESRGTAKITLQVPDLSSMDEIFAMAIEKGVNAYIVHDAGRTQIAAGSATVLALGPAPRPVLDELTGSLRLY